MLRFVLFVGLMCKSSTYVVHANRNGNNRNATNDTINPSSGETVPRTARGNARGDARGLRSVCVGGEEIGGHAVEEPEEGAGTAFVYVAVITVGYKCDARVG